MHREHGSKEKNESANRILDLVMSFDLLLANTCFIENEEHSIMFKSGFKQPIRFSRLV